MAFVTRSDAIVGEEYSGCSIHTSLYKAYVAAKTDKTIWKISYEDKDGQHRWIPRSHDGKLVWSDEPIRVISCEEDQTFMKVDSSPLQTMTDEEFEEFARQS